jgi:dephospho-CoA kinase
MIVIGTFAYCGSGQDTLATMISQKLDIPVYSMGDILRTIAKDNNLISTRQNLQNIRKHYDDKYGRSYFAQILAQEIKNKNETAIITGIRLQEEVEIFRNNFQNFYLIFVYAEESIRFNRLLRRNEEKDPKDFKEFLVQMENEKKIVTIQPPYKQFTFKKTLIPKNQYTLTSY